MMAVAATDIARVEREQDAMDLGSAGDDKDLASAVMLKAGAG